jgi:hypothetical protein
LQDDFERIVNGNFSTYDFQRSRGANFGQLRSASANRHIEMRLAVFSGTNCTVYMFFAESAFVHADAAILAVDQFLLRRLGFGIAAPQAS